MQLTWTLFSSSLTPPLQLKTGTLSIRKGIKLTLMSGDIISEGEASPLPGFSTETLQEVEKRLPLIQKKCQNKTMPSVADILTGNLGLSKNLPASLYFGLELAMLNHHAQRLQTPLSALLLPYTGATQVGDAKRNALLSGTSQHIFSTCKKKLTQGFQCFKLKVGAKPPQDEIAIIKALLAMMPSYATLRLDANRLWDLQTAVEVGAAISHPQIDYIEEPLKNPSGWTSFYQKTGIPIALDESLIENKGQWTLFKGLKALILKPTLLGGIYPSIQLAKRGMREGLVPVISSTFESPIALKGLAQLAASLPIATYHGLDSDTVH